MIASSAGKLAEAHLHEPAALERRAASSSRFAESYLPRFVLASDTVALNAAGARRSQRLRGGTQGVNDSVSSYENEHLAKALPVLSAGAERPVRDGVPSLAPSRRLESVGFDPRRRSERPSAPHAIHSPPLEPGTPSMMPATPGRNERELPSESSIDPAPRYPPPVRVRAGQSDIRRAAASATSTVPDFADVASPSSPLGSPLSDGHASAHQVPIIPLEPSCDDARPSDPRHAAKSAEDANAAAPGMQPDPRLSAAYERTVSIPIAMHAPTPSNASHSNVAARIQPWSYNGSTASPSSSGLGASPRSTGSVSEWYEPESPRAQDQSALHTRSLDGAEFEPTSEIDQNSLLSPEPPPAQVHDRSTAAPKPAARLGNLTSIAIGAGIASGIALTASAAVIVSNVPTQAEIIEDSPIAPKPEDRVRLPGPVYHRPIVAGLRTLAPQVNNSDASASSLLL